MFYGFNKKKRSTISGGDWDRDGVPNRKDCEPFNWKKQDGGGQFMGGKDPFESKIRIAQEKSSGKWIVSGKGIFKIVDTKEEAQRIMEELK